MKKRAYILENARYHNFFLSDGTLVAPSDGHDFHPVLDIIFDSPLDNQTLLDIGCSNGFYTIEASKRGAVCTGLDHSVAFLKTASLIAEDASQEIDFIQGRWPNYGEGLEDNKFDIVLLMNVVHHAPSKEESFFQLTEAMRVSSSKLILCIANYEKKSGKIYHDNKKIRELLIPKFPYIKTIPYLEAGGNCEGRTIFCASTTQELFLND